ncbi:MAG: class aldolase/adducin family protein, partial [Clostridiales bacterium]|nr:class aldolase/adducin family protein [Clostridiales bacterium]
MNVNAAKELVVKAGIRLVESGLIARTWGNVSCRIDEYSFVITPSGRDYLSLTADEIVTVKISDCSYSGNIKPSSEKGVHAKVYKLYSEANFVIHTHQENASVISA